MSLINWPQEVVPAPQTNTASLSWAAAGSEVPNNNNVNKMRMFR